VNIRFWWIVKIQKIKNTKHSNGFYVRMHFFSNRVYKCLWPRWLGSSLMAWINFFTAIYTYHPLILNNAIADLFSLQVSNCLLLSNTFHCWLVSYTCSYMVSGRLDQWILLFLIYSGHQWSFNNWSWHVWLFGWLWFSLYIHTKPHQ